MILLLPIGAVEAGLVHHLADRLSVALDLQCCLGDQIGSSARAYDRSRDQYRDRDLLHALTRPSRPDAQRVLGIIDADCCAPGLDFVFRQAQPNGRNAFVALARLRPSFLRETGGKRLDISR